MLACRPTFLGQRGWWEGPFLCAALGPPRGSSWSPAPSVTRLCGAQALSSEPPTGVCGLGDQGTGDGGRHQTGVSGAFS